MDSFYLCVAWWGGGAGGGVSVVEVDGTPRGEGE